ncbi:MAG: glycosyltransferase [Vicinamibacterales bacterium]
MRRVLMISPHFPPDTSAGTHRVRLFAPYLRELGWEPTVVSVDPSGYEGRLDPDLARLVPDTVRVVRTRAWSAGVTRRAGIGDLGLRALAGLGRECARLMAAESFDALFITIYPTYPAVLGPLLKRRHRVPFVLDYQDPWVSAWGLDVGPHGAPDARSRLTRALAIRLEPPVVRAADALTAVSARTYEDVLARVPDARPRACAAIPLGFDERDLDALRRAPRVNTCFDERDGHVHVCYVGTVLPRGFDVLRTLLAALARVRDRAPRSYARLRVHFLGTSNQRSQAPEPRVLPAARDAGVDDIVTEAPARLDYLDALNVQTRAQALLLLGSNEPHYTPSKVFPALLARRPIVACCHAASSVVEVLRQPAVNARVFTFEDVRELPAHVDGMAAALADLARGDGSVPAPSLDDGLQAWSARALTGRLAAVLDAVTTRA